MKPLEICTLICTLMLTGCPLAEADTPVPPIQGDVSELRVPKSLHYGWPSNGLRLGIWSERANYFLNHRINVWIGITTGSDRPISHSLMADDILFKDSFLFVTLPDGKVVKLRESGTIDGSPGLGWMGGASGELHKVIRKPGRYRVEWRIGKLRSPVVGFTITRSR